MRQFRTSGSVGALGGQPPRATPLVLAAPYCVYSQYRRWVVERSYGWMARFRRLARDYERLAVTLAGLHFVAFAMLMAHRFATFMVQNA